MEEYHDKVSDVNSPRKNNLKEQYNLPVIALFLNVTPVLLMLLMRLHLLTDNHIVLHFCLIMFFIWMMTGLGGLFHLASIILAICYLCSMRKRATSTGVVLSVISILFPFVLWFVFIVFEIVDLRMIP